MKTLIIAGLLTFFGVCGVKAQENTTIKTNATCAAGQERVITELKKMDGVFGVTFNAQGTITLDYSSDGTPYNDIVLKVTECGFTANGIEPKNGDKNLCKSSGSTGKSSKN